jgi:sterol desaturase/sphingolipid hydroxylase (fatty acid hydroxylase superfamily)
LARERLQAKSSSDWTLDIFGLCIQGLLIPAGQLVFIPLLLRSAWPQGLGSWNLPGWSAFLLAFIGTDLLYHFNHRILHRFVWPVHRVHHGVRDFDVFGTSRNPLWASFLLVYLWVDGAFLALLNNPAPYAAGMLATQALDLWRHSDLDHPFQEWFLGWIFITPRQHAWHHSAQGCDQNFGANLNVWDRLTGTFHRPLQFPLELGLSQSLSPARQLGWPFP